MGKRVEYFNHREFQCWLTGPSPEPIDAHYPDAPHKRKRTDLTKAETYALKMHDKGWTPLRIANSMNIAEFTARKYLASAQAKQRLSHDHP